jgi:cell division protein FtsB
MTEPAPVAAPSKPSPSTPVPSRFTPRLRRSLRWATGLLLVFALGLGATWLVRVRPLQVRVEALEQERSTLEAQAAELQRQVQDMNAVRSENITLKVDQARLEQQRLVLQAMTGTAKAQLALAGGSTSEAPATLLAQVDGQLSALQEALAGSMQQGVGDLRDRLALAAGEVTSDPFAAQRDLEILANGLSMLEEQLSGA